jgi:type IV pilus assembly protein PilY1
MKSSRFTWLAGAMSLLALLHGPARAEDTDLFANANSSSTATANMLFIVDNAAAGSANAAGNSCSINSSGAVSSAATVPSGYTATALSGTTMGTIQCAMYAALSGLTTTDTASFNIAIMMFTSNGNKKFVPNNSSTLETGGSLTGSCPNASGGCVVVPLTGFTTNTKAQLLFWIKNWSSSPSSDYNIKAGTDTSQGGIMQEAWAFYKGKTGVSGTTYTAPTTGCKNFVVFVGNAYDNQMTPKDKTGADGPKDPLLGTSGTSGKNADPVSTTAERTLPTGTIKAEYNIAATPTTSALVITCSSGGTSATFTTSENSGVYGIPWARYMYNNMEIKSFSIGLLGSGCKADYPVWLDYLAAAGASQFFPTNNFETLSAAIKTVLSQIISVNTVFASVSLPVSVNTQGSYLNQVYIGMFRPDASFLPRWYGNLKQYKLGFVNSVLKLVDADSVSAVSTATGFITECARSYWTPTAVNTYWNTGVTTTCTTISGSKESDYPDGNVVEKGGHGYMLRKVTKDPANRVVKTCAPTMAGCTAMVDFNTSLSTGTYTTTLFGIAATDDRDNLINYARGSNFLATTTNLQAGDNEQSLGTGKYRASSHGDVMHSRPVAINYGDDTTPRVVVYYGSNDGMMHAINGSQTATVGTSAVEAGEEIWSFMPPEFYGRIKRLYINTEAIAFKGGPSGSTAKDYGMDGPFTAFTGTIGGVAKKYIYATMRRGGRAVYAFDVTTPDSPSLLWKAGCSSASLTSTDCTVGSQDYSAIGQTWASPRIFYAAAHNAGSDPLILMAGGYDTCEDTETGSKNHNCDATTPKGNRIYVLNAANGEIVKEFATVGATGTIASPVGSARSVIADATIVPDSTGKAKYAYIADMGGVVYRIKLSGSSTSQWSITPIAKVGCGTSTSATLATTCNANRKFMFQPSVVSADGTRFYILLGTGDREKPVYAAGTYYPNSGAVSNYFFAIQDEPENTSWPGSAVTTACGDAIICLAALQQIDGTSDATVGATTVDSTKKGWFLTMQAQEQIVTSAITIFGVTTFSTHSPPVSAGSCTRNLGTTRVYNINYADATSANGTSNRYEHVSGDGLPPSPVAGKVLINGTPVPFCIGCSKDSPLEGKKAVQSSSVSRARTRLYWYLEKN